MGPFRVLKHVKNKFLLNLSLFQSILIRNSDFHQVKISHPLKSNFLVKHIHPDKAVGKIKNDFLKNLQFLILILIQ